MSRKARVLSPRGNPKKPRPEVCGLVRLIAYKIRQLELLEKSTGPGGADLVGRISLSLLRERTYAESIVISSSPDIHEKALRSYYLLLGERLGERLEKEKKSLGEQILIHKWRS